MNPNRWAAIIRDAGDWVTDYFDCELDYTEVPENRRAEFLNDLAVELQLRAARLKKQPTGE